MAVLELKETEPSTPKDLFGSETNQPQHIARVLWNAVDDVLNYEDENLAFAITGAPGIGKTTIANMIAVKLTGSRFAVDTENGKDIGVQRVRDMKMEMHNSSLFSTTGHRCWIINEGDKITDDGQVAFLSLLDEQPTKFHVLVTSNEELDDWSERFHSRFEVYNIEAPCIDDISVGLTGRLDVDPRVGQAAAEHCGGNVRQAIKEINAWKRKNKPLKLL